MYKTKYQENCEQHHVALRFCQFNKQNLCYLPNPDRDTSAINCDDDEYSLNIYGKGTLTDRIIHKSCIKKTDATKIFI